MLVFSATDQPAYGYSCNGDEVELFSVRKDQQSGGAGASAADTSLDVSDGAVTLETSFESSRDGYPDLYDSNPTDECDDNDISFRVYDDSVEIVENSISIVEPAVCGSAELCRFTGPLASRGGSTGRSSSSDIPIPVGVVDKIQDSKGVLVMDFISRHEARDTVIDEEHGRDEWSENDENTSAVSKDYDQKARRRPRRRLGFLTIALLMVAGAIIALSVALLANRPNDGAIAAAESTVSTTDGESQTPDEGQSINGPENVPDDPAASPEQPIEEEEEIPAQTKEDVSIYPNVPPSENMPTSDFPAESTVSTTDGESQADEGESINGPETVPDDPAASPEQPIEEEEEEIPAQTKEDVSIYPNVPPSENMPTSDIPDHVAHVIHIVVDGLRPDYMNGPNFDRLKSEGACTLNARHDYASSQTQPNHIGMFTGLIIADHGYYEDADTGGTLVDANTGQGFQNIFDLVTNAGGTTAFYGSKEKFAIFDRSWSINAFVLQKRGFVLVPLFLEDMNKSMYNYAFLHVRNPDRAGHKDGGASSPFYSAEVAEADSYLGQVFDLIQNNPELRDNTAIVLTADHGFADVGNHADKGMLENYRIPFCSWGPGVIAGADLIELNRPEHGGIITDPGTSRGQEGDRIIRNSYSGILAASWLGLRPSSGPFSEQYLKYRWYQ